MSSTSTFRVVESFRVTPRVTLLLARGSVLEFVPRRGVDVGGGYGSTGFGTNRSIKNVVPSAIVNAANPGCLGGGGVDGAITDAGGPNLAKDRLKLPMIRSAEGLVRCPTGSAVRTGPNRYGDLRTPYVIHAVGPNYNDYCSYSCYDEFEYGYTEDNEDPFRPSEQEQGWGFGDDGSRWEPGHKLLRSAYQTSLDLALEVKCHQVAFSLLSAGVYRGPVPLHQIFELTAKSIQEWAFQRLDDDPSSSSIPTNGITMSANDEEYNDSSQPMEVILCAYSPSECQTLVEACRRVLAT